jgi:hypothetical protein
MFAPPDSQMPPDDLVVRAADLAEALVEAVSAPTQDWAQIAEWAAELVALARRVDAEDSGT